jgi:hypothetical protein
MCIKTCLNRLTTLLTLVEHATLLVEEKGCKCTHQNISPPYSTTKSIIFIIDHSTKTHCVTAHHQVPAASMVCWYSLRGLSCSVAWPMFRRKKPLCKKQSGNRCESAAKHGPCWHERFSWMPQRKLIHGHLAWKLAYGVIRGEPYMYQQAATVEPRNRCSIIESTQSLVKDTTYDIKQDSWPPGRIQGLGVKIWRWNRQLICICQVLQLIYIQSWKPHSIGTCVLHHPVFTLYHKNQPHLCPLLSHNIWVECSEALLPQWGTVSPLLVVLVQNRCQRPVILNLEQQQPKI